MPAQAIAPFDLGAIVATRGAIEVLTPHEASVMLNRHRRGDWGDVCPEDAAMNNSATVDGCRILSAYDTKAGTRIWIITEADRSSTTILLPEEY